MFAVTVRLTQQVSAERKHQTSRSWGDVPLPIVLGVVSVLVAGFVPHIVTGPTLPESLPAIALNPRESAAAHRLARRAPVPSYVDQAFDRLGDASARRDGAVTALAARDFAEALVQAAGDDEPARAALRESMTDRFIAQLDRRAHEGFAQVALRHRIVAVDRAPDERERAIARAWFAFRWEALGARASLRAEHVALDHTAQRLSVEDRRALFAWVLDADCSALLGAPTDAQLSRAQIQRCSSVRTDFVTLATAIERSYPRAEAIATIDALEARSLLALSRSVSDPPTRTALVSSGRDALARAHGRFLSLAARGNERRLQRYMLGTDFAAPQ